MFFSRYEPALNKYLLYNKTDLYYFSCEEIKEFLDKGKVVINKEYPEIAYVCACYNFNLR